MSKKSKHRKQKDRQAYQKKEAAAKASNENVIAGSFLGADGTTIVPVLSSKQEETEELARAAQETLLYGDETAPDFSGEAEVVPTKVESTALLSQVPTPPKSHAKSKKHKVKTNGHNRKAGEPTKRPPGTDWSYEVGSKLDAKGQRYKSMGRYATLIAAGRRALRLKRKAGEDHIIRIRNRYSGVCIHYRGTLSDLDIGQLPPGIDVPNSNNMLDTSDTWVTRPKSRNQKTATLVSLGDGDLISNKSGDEVIIC